MRKIYVVIAVDVIGALAAKSLKTNVYMADTNKYLGSWQEGASNLHTVCQDGQVITWSAASIDPGDAVTITGFSGAMVDQGVCKPQANIMEGDGVFEGRVETQGGYGGFNYTVTLDVGGQTMAVDAQVKVV